MAWYIDDTLLSTLAYNVSNRSAGWKVPAKRGENLVIPGRNGAQWLPNKPFEQGQLSLSMWAVGANTDGTIPAFGDSAQNCRQNLDKLTALFAQTSRLLEVKQVTGKAFGGQNVFTNPAMEGFTTPVAAYQNFVQNPAMRRTTPTVQIQNQILNPRIVTGQATLWQANYDNAFPDPLARLNRAGSATGGPVLPFTTVTTVNYWAPANFENYANGDVLVSSVWTTAANTAQQVVTMSAADQSVNQPGTQGFRILSTAALAINASLGSRPPLSFPLTTQSTYTPWLSFKMRRTQNVAGTRTVQVRLVTTNDAGTTVYASGAWQSYTLPAYAGWTTVFYDGTGKGVQPNGTSTRIRVEFRTGEAWASGDGFLMDQVQLSAYEFIGRSAGYWDAQPGPFWDGDSVWAGPNYVTAGNANSIGRWNAELDTRWAVESSTGASSAYYAWAERPSDGDPTGYTLGFVAHGFQTGGTQGYRHTLSNLEVGRYYSIRGQFRGASGGTYRVQLLKKGTGDSDYVVATQVVITGQGVPVNYGGRITTAAVSARSGSYLVQSGDVFQLRVEVPVRADGHEGFQLIGIGVQTGHLGVFSGDNAATANSQYRWEGTAYNSRSIADQRRAKRVTGRHAMAYIAAFDVNATGTAVEFWAPADGTPTSLVFEDVALPASHTGITASADVLAAKSDLAIGDGANVPIAIQVQCLDSGGGTLATFSTSYTHTAFYNGGSTTFIRQSVRVPATSVPAATTTVRLSLVQTNPLMGSGAFVTDAMVIPTGMDPATLSLPTYFDGASTSSTWAGTADDSLSSYWATLPTLWTTTAGVSVPAPGFLGAKNTTTVASNLPTVIVSIPMRQTLALGPYVAGCEVNCRAEDANGNEISDSTPIDVIMEFRSGTSTIVGAVAGTITGRSTAWKQLQGWMNATASFTDVRLIFRPQRPGVALVYARVKTMHVYGINTSTYTCPVQRIDWNKIQNPNFAHGLERWRTLANGTNPTITGNSTAVLGTATLVSSDIPAVAGNTLHLQHDMRRTGATALQSAVRWCTLTRRNRATNPDFTTVTGITAAAATVATSTAWTQSGTTSLMITPDGSSNGSWAFPVGASGGMDKMGLVSGSTYTFSAYVRLTAAQTGTLHALARRIVIDVTNVSGAVTLAVASSSAATNAAGVTRLSVTYAIPANTRDVAVRLVNGSINSGDVTWWDALLIEDGSALNTYFTGATADTTGVWYRWNEAANNSWSDMVSYTETSGVSSIASAFENVSEAKTVPSGSTTFAVVTFTGAGGELSYSYAGIGFATHEDAGRYDASTFPYADGASTADVYGQPTAWSGIADDSTSLITPAIPNGFAVNATPQGLNLNVVDPGTLRPSSGSYGKSAAPPRIASGTSANYRTIGVQRLSDQNFLSGEVAIAHQSGITATFGVYGAASATGSGTLLYSATVTNPTGQKLSWRDLNVTAFSHFYAQLGYAETGNRAGYGLMIDNLMFLPTGAEIGADYPDYFDGNSPGAGWVGVPNASASQFFGGGRRAFAEVVDAIDMSSMAGGTRAEFVVDMNIPSSFWEDLIISSVPVSLTNAQLLAGTSLDLVQLAGTTAPIDDALITINVNGTLTDLTITDEATGGYLKITGTLPTSAAIVINNAQFTVTSGGSSLITSVVRGGSNQLLPVTPVSASAAPRFRFLAASGSGTLTGTVAARRRYVIA